MNKTNNRPSHRVYAVTKNGKSNYWQAIGADGPWRVTPNLMVVVPTSTHVVLHYGFTPVDNAGRLASVGGLIADIAAAPVDSKRTETDGHSTVLVMRSAEHWDWRGRVG